MTSTKNLLPIGTIVLLKGGKKRLMIFGIRQCLTTANSNKEEYDYIGVPYPEGNVGTECQFVFNHENIETVFLEVMKI